MRLQRLYELAHAQTDHEQQISAELATRGGLLAALAGLVAVGLTEFGHFHGRSLWLICASAILIAGIIFLAAASMGMTYERPDGARAWEQWAEREDRESSIQETDETMTKFLYEKYADCVSLGMCANDRKAHRLNWASGFITLSLLCLLLALLFS